jgi:uncharacterized protein (TIGR02680 family)
MMEKTVDLPQPSRPRWELLRAGIQNVWEYDDQRFVFHRGRLLLRGRNEAGKSKALEVLLPFLLDGDLAPQRLDPFGSTSRQMRWNLLGERNADKEIGLGYVWVELGRMTESGPETLTLGAGLKARRSDTKVESWFFITSRRIDDDLHPLDESRRPLDRRRLEEVIGDCGTVFRSKGEYRAEVDRRLFGLGPDQYDALIETLIQLRKPQLSKQLDPAQLSDILTRSLPPLDREVVRHLAEGFARLDKHRAQRDGWKRTFEAVEAFRKVYRRYAVLHVAARAQAMTGADSRYQKAREVLRVREEALAAARDALAAAEARITELEREEQDLRTRLETLRASEAYRAVEALDAAEKEAGARRAAAETAEADLKEAGDARGRAAKARDEVQGRLKRAGERLREGSAVAETAAGEAAWVDAHRSIAGLLDTGDLAAARGTLMSLLDARRRAIAEVAGAQETVSKAARRVEHAEAEVRRAEEAVRAAKEKQDTEARAREAAERAFSEDAHAWVGSLAAIRLSDEEASGLLEETIEKMRSRAEGIARAQRAALDDGIASARASAQRVAEGIEKVEAERNALLEKGHRPPEAPPWRGDRQGRPGAPLYLLCEPGDGLEPGAWPRVEAALEASGLLDAWVTPDGALLSADTFDVLLTPVAAPPPDGARTLADVVTPAAAGGVPEAAVTAVLRTVSVVEAGAAAPERGAWVATDGRFGLGPLLGRWEKDAVEHLGASAREAARLRRLEDLAALIETLGAERAAHLAEAGALASRRQGMDEELSRFPNTAPVFTARARADAADEAVVEAARALEGAAVALSSARADHDAAIRKRDAVARTHGLSAWVDALADLKERTEAYRAAAGELFAAAEAAQSTRSELTRAEAVVAEAEGRVARAASQAEAAGAAARAAAQKARTLRETQGATRDRILEEVQAAEGRQGEVATDLSAARKEKGEGDRRLGNAESEVQKAGEQVGTAETDREAAAASFRRLAAAGLIQEVALSEDFESPPAGWSLTETLLTARKVAAEAQTGAADDDALDRAENKVMTQQTDLGRQLMAGVRLSPSKQDGILVYEASLHGRASSLRQLAEALAGEVRSRDALLDAEERELFESFLSGETHEHLRQRLRDARALVDRMNDELQGRPTPGGMRIRLNWKPDEEAPPGTAQAIDLLLRSAALLSGSDRQALSTFLRQRLDEARGGEAEAPGTGLSERLLDVLDYRAWFSFIVEYKEASGGFRPLTRKAHGAGSGGQKSVMLHLPLFAAAAAFYASARPGAPRLVLLDEAFAGIDRKMRGSLMGLLVAFDLDFIMTSYEEWGFYAELDGLATYNLVRDPAMPGVLCERFVWDGERDREVAA